MQYTHKGETYYAKDHDTLAAFMQQKFGVTLIPTSNGDKPKPQPVSAKHREATNEQNPQYTIWLDGEVKNVRRFKDAASVKAFVEKGVPMKRGWTTEWRGQSLEVFNSRGTVQFTANFRKGDHR